VSSVDDVVSVEDVVSVDDDLVEAVGALVSQLSRRSPPPSRAALEHIVDDPQTYLFVARDGASVVGMLTLATFLIPTAWRGWIEDVVVDEASRGKGVAGALIQRALDRAAEVGCRTVDLTSRPDRGAANRLYTRLGFEARNTNVFRYDLQRP
jgi:ribosomal protein S18 acetylase RimI-like enzyme